jgi:hypothetical protein
MWNAIPYDVMTCIATLAPLQALCVFCRLEKRCATMKAAVKRLACARILKWYPYNCTVEQILGLPNSDFDFFLVSQFVGEFCDAIESGALPQLVSLWLQNTISFPSARFASALVSGALPQLNTLWLNANEIGNDGMQAFAAACGSGAIPQLQVLGLGGNQIGNSRI